MHKVNKEPLSRFTKAFRTKLRTSLTHTGWRKLQRILLTPVLLFIAYIFTSDSYISPGCCLCPPSGIYFDFMLGAFAFSVLILTLIFAGLVLYSLITALLASSSHI